MSKWDFGIHTIYFVITAVLLLIVINLLSRTAVILDKMVDVLTKVI